MLNYQEILLNIESAIFYNLPIGMIFHLITINLNFFHILYVVLPFCCFIVLYNLSIIASRNSVSF